MRHTRTLRDSELADNSSLLLERLLGFVVDRGMDYDQATDYGVAEAEFFGTVQSEYMGNVREDLLRGGVDIPGDWHFAEGTVSFLPR